MTALAPAATIPRRRFLQRVARAFDEAKVDYVFLHGFGSGAHDSDVDVAVGRESVGVVDLLTRIGRFGRLLQRIDYDIPWSRYYIFETDEPGRRYRQLDVACDPHGIGRYGRAVSVALANRRRVDGMCVPTAAAEAVYLAVKRARKGLDAAGLEELCDAFAEDPDGSSGLLGEAFGSVGNAVAEAVRTGANPEKALSELARLVDRQQRSPASLGLRTAHQVRRFFGRVARPTGLVVGLVGPDGVGKSTLADRLETGALGAFRRVERFHLTPGLLPSPARLLGRRVAAVDDPHARAPSGRVGSSARAAYLVLDTVLGWPVRVSSRRVKSTLVIQERGLLDLTIDPRRYRLRRTPRFVARVQRLLPKPDLVLALDAPPAAVRERRQELTAVEIERQLLAWRARAELDPARVRLLDAAAVAEDVLDASLGAIDDTLANRQLQLGEAMVALKCLGGPVPRGESYRLLSVGGRPRWLVPEGVNPLRVGLYRPTKRHHRAAGNALALGSRILGRAVRVDPESGIALRIAASLGLDRVELAAALPREAARSHRFVIAVLRDRELVAFGKVSSRPSELQREATVLEALRRCDLQHIAIPRVLDVAELEDVSVLLLSPLVTRGSTRRAMGSTEYDALVELAGLSDDLSSVLGREEGLVPTHGDFTGWNSARHAGRLVLWDWEAARLGLPLEDFFHWKVRRLLLLGVGDADATAKEALNPSPELADLARRLDAGSPVSALQACLRREAAESRDAYQLCQVRRMIRTLEGRT